jgi:predicted MFS family arabinose efflux permease
LNRWAILAMLFFARVAIGFQFQAIAAVSPLLIRDLAIDFALLGALIGVWMLPGVVVAIPGGLLGRRFGDKRVVCVGLALMALGTFITSGAETYSIAMAGRVVSGAGAVMVNVLLTKMVADWFHDRDLASAMGVLVTSWPLGIGLALLLLVPLAAAASWSFAVQLSAYVCIAAFLGIGLVYRRPPVEKPTPAAASAMSRRDLTVAIFAGMIWTLYNVAYIVVVGFAPVLLAAKGMPVASAAVVASFAAWPLMLSLPLGGYLADRTGRGQAIMVGGFVAMAATMPLMLVAPSPLAMLALFGLVAGPAGGIIAALPGRLLAPAVRHLGLGIFFTLYYIGMALLPGLAGWLRDRSQLDAAPLLVGGALLLIAAVLAVVLQNKLVRTA